MFDYSLNSYYYYYFLDTLFFNRKLNYISKFMVESLPAHPDFSVGTWSMNSLLQGANDIMSENNMLISSALSNAVTTVTVTQATIFYW